MPAMAVTGRTDSIEPVTDVRNGFQIMHPVPLRQFRNRRIIAQRLKRNLRLERVPGVAREHTEVHSKGSDKQWWRANA